MTKYPRLARLLMPLMAFACVAAPSKAAAIFTISLIDIDDNVTGYLDGVAWGPGYCLTPQTCSVGYSIPTTTISSSLPQSFNIYADAGLTDLTDTLALTAFGGGVGFSLVFHADIDGTPLTPLSGPGTVSLVGTGGLQTATTIDFADGSQDIIQFQSDVPEPGYAPFLGLLWLGRVALRRRIS